MYMLWDVIPQLCSYVLECSLPTSKLLLKDFLAKHVLNIFFLTLKLADVHFYIHILTGQKHICAVLLARCADVYTGTIQISIPYQSMLPMTTKWYKTMKESQLNTQFNKNMCMYA